MEKGTKFYKLKYCFSNPQISLSRLKTKKRQIWKKVQIFIKSNKFKIIKINLEV